MTEYKVGDIVRILTLEEAEGMPPSIYGNLDRDWFKYVGNKICEVVKVLHGAFESRYRIRDVSSGEPFLISELYIDSAVTDWSIIDQIAYETSYMTFMFGEHPK